MAAAPWWQSASTRERAPDAGTQGTEAAASLGTTERELSGHKCPAVIQTLVPMTRDCDPSTSATVSTYLCLFTRGVWPDVVLVLAAWREAGDRPVGRALWMLL